ncbi:MAG: SDR family oxidoreductase [Phaeodactylibacter sp.]|nr:SDR family oxidoreductase [Phaeodactylibacter sp.]MCB9297756.1 SDR family oxidoreductase [Lewinellaceae bacterium]
MSILITGVSGFLGSHVARLLEERRRPFTGFYNMKKPDIPAEQLDLFDRKEVLQRLEELQPSAILHLAAAASPNWCELHPKESQVINVDVPIALANYAREAGIPFLFTSTDLVFDGQSAPYDEEWAPSPICTYGMQKAAAEQGVLLACPEAAVVRLPLLYGWGNNFLKQWLESLKAGQPLPAFVDEFRSPAYVQDAAHGLLMLLDLGAAGFFHLGGPEPASRFDMATHIARAFGIDERLVQPARQADVAMPAPRPADVSLSSERAYALGYQPRGMEEALGELGGM